MSASYKTGRSYTIEGLLRYMQSEAEYRSWLPRERREPEEIEYESWHRRDAAPDKDKDAK